jgi:hypothetical protein
MRGLCVELSTLNPPRYCFNAQPSNAYNESRSGAWRDMGIRFLCPNGHRLNVKEDLAGRRGICPNCGAKFLIPSADGSQQPVAVAATAAINPTVVRGSPDPAHAASGVRKPAQNADLRTTPFDIPMADSPAVGQLPTFDEPVANAVSPPAPVSKYVASRARARRNQTTIAILLLLAVLVLAPVLVLVLQNGPWGQ